MTQEGIKEQTLDDAFIVDDSVKAEEIKDEKQQEGVSPEVKSEDSPASAAEEAQKTWKDYGLAEFDGLSEEEVAKKIIEERKQTAYRNKLYGDQANVVGELRKKVETLEGKFEKPPEKEKTEVAHPELLDIEDMSEQDILDYNSLYEKSPVKAILKYGSKAIKSLVQSEIKNVTPKVQEEIDTKIKSYADAQEYFSLVKNHEDTEQVRPIMETLDKPEYLGKQARPLEDLYQLAKIAKPDDTGKPSDLFAAVYSYMVKYPNMSFQEASEIVSLKSKPDTTTQSAQIRQEVKDKVKAVDNLTTTTKKQGTTNIKPAASVDDAFEM